MSGWCITISHVMLETIIIVLHSDKVLQQKNYCVTCLIVVTLVQERSNHKCCCILIGGAHLR